MGINFSDIENKILTHGTSLSITLYSGTTPQFSFEQVPIFQSTGTTRTALILEPNMADIKSSGGIVTSISRKLIFPKDFDAIDINDDITFESGTLRVIQIQNKITRTVVFANKLNN
mgnify:CR=1 FL=1